MTSRVTIDSTYDIDRKDEVVIIHLRCDSIDVNTAADFRKLMEELAGGCQYLIIDLKHVEFIDSTGLGTFYPVRNILKQKGGGLIVTSLHPRVQALFKLVCADTIIQVFDNLETALIETQNRFKT